MTTTYCLPNGASQLVFSSATTSYGARSGSGSTGWPLHDPRLHPLHDLAGLVAAFPGLQPARRLRHPEEQRHRDQDVQPGQQPQVSPVLAGEPVVRDDAGQDDQEQEDADGLADHASPGAGHVGPMISLMYTTLMARNPANPSVSAIDRTNQRRVVRHVPERPDEHPGQHRGQDQGLAPADLVGQPAEGVAADQDADPGLQGVQDVVLGVRDVLGRQPDERVQPRRRSRRSRPTIAQPTCTIRQISQAMKLMGRRSTRAAISPGMTRVPPPRRPRLPRCLVPLQFSLLPSGVRGWRGKAGKGAPGRCRRWTLPLMSRVPGSRSAMLVIKRGLRRVRRRPST